MKNRKGNMPSLGLRIIKSAIAVEICFLISFLRDSHGIVFFSQLATLWCIQMYADGTKKNALQRIIGTVIGAVYGLVVLLAEGYFNITPENNSFLNSLLVSGMIVIVLYTTVVIKKKQASYFSCVVFLSIVVNHITDTNPYLFVWNRFLDTIIGIVVGIGVNSFSLPRKKQKDILFVAKLDDILLHEKDRLSDYSKVELNRMLDEGIHFTVSTMRTPASMMESMRDVRLNLPVIVMNGAALYDINTGRYPKVCSIDCDTSRRIRKLAEENHLQCFSNVIVEDLLLIYFDESGDAVQKQLIRDLRGSLYRNYLHRALPPDEAVAYFMLFHPKQVIEEFYKSLEKQEFAKKLRILKYDSDDYPGYAYIKIYNKDATQQNMMKYLKQKLTFEKMVTFGSKPGQYDVVISPGDTNDAVHKLKKQYEPIAQIRDIFR